MVVMVWRKEGKADKRNQCTETEERNMCKRHPVGHEAYCIPYI